MNQHRYNDFVDN